MNSEFVIYAQLGLHHIADFNGYDHILFVAALCALSQIQDWKRLLWLITAFTLGHSITLALSTLNIFSLPSRIVEFFIPCTIVLTCVFNIWSLRMNYSAESEHAVKKRVIAWYVVTLCFGFIHGMGFSTFLKSLLGQETNIIVPLLAFNLGLEAGQILIVAAVLIVSLIMTRFVGFVRRDWSLVLSGAVAGVALTLLLKNNPF